MDSVLIGGARRMGKTRLLHGWIQALLHGDEAMLYLWDGKPSCVEFGRYSHYKNVTVIGEQSLSAGVTELNEIMNGRAAMFAQAGAVDVSSYNSRSSQPVAPIVFIIDELASISMLSDADRVLRMIEDLISRGGAFGIYPVLATQRPTANACRGISKTNMQTRVCLAVPSHTDSQIVLERTGAEKLPKTKGRLAIVWNATLIEAQAYLVDLPEAPPGSTAQVLGATLEAQIGAHAVVTETDSQDVQSNGIPERDRQIIERCLSEVDGRFTMAWLTGLGFGQGAARRLQARYASNGWIVKDPALNNAFTIAQFVGL
jgi:hypothetical protein